MDKGKVEFKSARKWEGLPNDVVNFRVVLFAHQKQHIKSNIDLHKMSVEFSWEPIGLIEGLECNDLLVGQDKDKCDIVSYYNSKIFDLLIDSYRLTSYFLYHAVFIVSECKNL